MKILQNLLIFLVTLIIGLLIAEMLFRYLDGYEIMSEMEARSYIYPDLEQRIEDHSGTVPLHYGVEYDWFKMEGLGIEDQYHASSEYDTNGLILSKFGDFVVVNDRYKIWNIAMLQNLFCDSTGFKGLDFPFIRGTHANVFSTPDGSPHPAYRYPVNFLKPDEECAYNKWGWTGDEVSLEKDSNKIRIAFIGASTTQKGCLTSYPQWIQIWLNRWLESIGDHRTVEIINAGREGYNSTDLYATVRWELAAFKPDLIVSYIGFNQFYPKMMYDYDLYHAVIDRVSGYQGIWSRSAMLRRMALNLDLRLSEPSKPNVVLDDPLFYEQQVANWDTDNDEKLPLAFNEFVNDFKDINELSDQIGATFIMSSFAIIVDSQLQLHPIADQYIIKDIAEEYGAISYGDVRFWMNLQNEFFKKIASSYDIAFIDYDRYMPRDPALYNDVVHLNCEAKKLKAWIFTQQLIPILEEHLNNPPTATDTSQINLYPIPESRRIEISTELCPH